MFEFFSGRGALLIAGVAGLALVVLASLCAVSADAAPVTSPAGEGQTIYAKALNDHGCDATEWHFVINQVRGAQDAPVGITVTFGNGQIVYVPLEKFTGKVAHYTTYGNLDSVVTQATARIYASWSGQFNLSHGPCVTPTTTPTPTPTPTPTGTPTPSTTPTVTPSPTITPTTTPSTTATPIPTETITPTGTGTPTPPSEITTTIIPISTGVTQAPTSLPDTGGAPACEDSSCGFLRTLIYILIGGGFGTLFGLTLARARER